MQRLVHRAALGLMPPGRRFGGMPQRARRGIGPQHPHDRDLQVAFQQQLKLQQLQRIRPQRLEPGTGVDGAFEHPFPERQIGSGQVRRGRRRGGLVGRDQRAQGGHVQLEVPQPRQVRKHHHAVGLQLRRQGLLQRAPDGSAIQRRAVRRLDKGDQSGLARVLLRYDHRLGNPGVPAQRRFDFSGFDPVAADLDLPVGAPQKLQQPVGAQPAKVSGLKAAPAGPLWIVGKAALRQRGIVPVSARDIGA